MSNEPTVTRIVQALHAIYLYVMHTDKYTVLYIQYMGFICSIS